MTSIIPQAGNLTVILSAELATLGQEENAQRTEALRQRLARRFGNGQLFSVQACAGAYKGVGERSLAINAPVSQALAVGQLEGSEFGQESFLAIDHYGHGRLHYLDGDQESIGHYQDCAPGTREAWTTVIATGETFTIA